jgi:hypothetical protein
MTIAHAGAASLFAVEYTVVLAATVTGLTAVLVGVIGFFSTRMTAKVAVRQSEEETTRLKAEQEEARKKERQVRYHDLLSHERAFFNLTDAERGQISLDDFDEWQKKLNEFLTGVMLFGTAPTAAASADLFRIVGEVSSDARNRAGIDFEESLSQAFENHNKEWRLARRRLLDEMREDVAADRLPVDWAAMD